MPDNYFLAICKDRPNDPDGFVYTMYFVNNTDALIDRIDLKTGGFSTVDDELVNLVPGEKEFTEIPAKSFIEIENDDEGSFEFIIWFRLQITTGGSVLDLAFDVPKYLRGLKKVNEIPLLNKGGYVIYSG